MKITWRYAQCAGAGIRRRWPKGEALEHHISIKLTRDVADRVVHSTAGLSVMLVPLTVRLESDAGEMGNSLAARSAPHTRRNPTPAITTLWRAFSTRIELFPVWRSSPVDRRATGLRHAETARPPPGTSRSDPDVGGTSLPARRCGWPCGTRRTVPAPAPCRRRCPPVALIVSLSGGRKPGCSGSEPCRCVDTSTHRLHPIRVPVPDTYTSMRTLRTLTRAISTSGCRRCKRQPAESRMSICPSQVAHSSHRYPVQRRTGQHRSAVASDRRGSPPVHRRLVTSNPTQVALIMQHGRVVYDGSDNREPALIEPEPRTATHCFDVRPAESELTAACHYRQHMSGPRVDRRRAVTGRRGAPAE